MKNFILITFLFIRPQIMLAQGMAPEIVAFSIQNNVVGQYGKLEVALEITASYTNPYDYEEIAVSASFTGPDGATRLVDGFFMQDYELNTTNGFLNPIGEGRFKFRFSPDQLGTWSFVAQLSDLNGMSNPINGSFECIAPSGRNKGFVRTGSTNYLQFDNGEQYIPIGENMAWENNNPYLNYRDWLTNLSENGGNYIRLWHAHWGLGIEWKNGWSSFEGLGRYKESNCFYQDWLYDFCAEKGIYIMLALQHHGPVSTNVNPNWNDSPYNAANGGPCQNTWDFFSNEEAIAYTRNRYRYILARWGYSRSIMSWELFNEVNWTDNFSTHQVTIQDWHADMAAYIKNLDPYQHLVTTSYAHENLDPVVWQNPDFDLTQTHFYINSSNIERALAGGVRRYLHDFQKPTLTGEFGLGGSPNLSNTDPDGIHLHNGMWGALFGGGMGTAMSWWWDVYIHPRDLYYHFAPISRVAEEVPFLEQDMRPTSSYTAGTEGDLILTPNLGWGVKGDETIIINENGTTEPSSPGLGQYLYGSQWNTQYRSPPSFRVTYQQEGEFIVKTNTDSGQSPRISIYLNGSLVLNQSAGPNETFSIAVPPGPNLIKVDNLGTDWITIASYTFTTAGSKVDVYTLTSSDRKIAAGWVLNHEYNHQNIIAGDIPEPVNGSEVVIDSFLNGDYFVKWYDCITGDIIWSEAVSAVNNQLLLPVPELLWDLAFRVDEEQVMVASKDVFRKLDFEVYPNPVKAGGEIYFSLDDLARTELKYSIFDAAGKGIESAVFDPAGHKLPLHLPAGLYWIKLQSPDGIIGTKGIFIN